MKSSYLALPDEQRGELLKSGVILTKQQRMFLQEYVRTGKILTAMRYAGYKGSPAYLIKNGYKILKSEIATPYLKALEEEESLHRSVTREYIVVKLKEIVEDKEVKSSDKINALNTLARVSNIIKDSAGENGKVVLFQAIGLDEVQKDSNIIDLPV